MGSRTGGQRAAILLSLVASAKANQVEPWAYLTHLFTRLAERRQSSEQELEALLPDRWLAENPQHRWHIDTLRAAERKRSRETRIAKRRRRKK